MGCSHSYDLDRSSISSSDNIILSGSESHPFYKLTGTRSFFVGVKLVDAWELKLTIF